MHFSKRSLRCILFTFLLFFTSIYPAFASGAHDEPVIREMKIWLVSPKGQQELRLTPAMKWETEKILANIHHLAGLNSFSLPRQYYLLQFPKPVLMPPFSPVNHPIEQMIIALPKERYSPYRLLIQNQHQQWMEYQTTRSLQILVHQIQAWNP